METISWLRRNSEALLSFGSYLQTNFIDSHRLEIPPLPLHFPSPCQGTKFANLRDL